MATSNSPNGATDVGDAADKPAQAPGAHHKLGSADEKIVVATFASRHAAERMLASLGPSFRRKARKRAVAAFVVTGNADGTFSLVQSRMLTASGGVATAIGIAVFTVTGLFAIIPAFKGARKGAHAARKHKGHVGADNERLRDMLSKAGPHAAVAIVRCADAGEEAAVVTSARARAGEVWSGSRAEFLAGLEAAAGNYDWALPALEEPSKGND